MATAQAQIAANPERRRSERWPLALPLVVRGVSLGSKSFQEETITLSVNAHGALLALATTVTLGQTLFLRNSQTQDEVGAWVTRFGHPRGGLAQVGIEFVRPDASFWSNRPHPGPPPAELEGRAEEKLLVLARPGTKSAPESISLQSGGAAPEAQLSPPGAGTEAGPASPAILLQALEQTLRQAADQAEHPDRLARLRRLSLRAPPQQ